MSFIILRVADLFKTITVCTSHKGLELDPARIMSKACVLRTVQAQTTPEPLRRGFYEVGQQVQDARIHEVGGTVRVPDEVHVAV